MEIPYGLENILIPLLNIGDQKDCQSHIVDCFRKSFVF